VQPCFVIAIAYAAVSFLNYYFLDVFNVSLYLLCTAVFQNKHLQF
jgi:hypothetical protein